MYVYFATFCLSANEIARELCTALAYKNVCTIELTMLLFVKSRGSVNCARQTSLMAVDPTAVNEQLC